MSSTNQHFYRIALVSTTPEGCASFSWQAKEALEAQGNTVFFFTPRSFPALFEGGCFCLSALETFVRMQDLDCVIVADGLGIQDAAAWQRVGHEALGLLCATAQEACLSAKLSEGVAFDFTLLADAPVALEAPVMPAACGRVVAVPPYASRAYIATPLANTVAHAPVLLCVQPGTDERVAALSLALKRPKLEGCRVCCLGEGWPAAWQLNPSGTQLAYASREAFAVVVFNESGASLEWNTGQARDALLALPLVSGAAVVAVGEAPQESAWASRMVEVPAQDAGREALAAALAHAYEAKPAVTALPVLPDGEESFAPMLDEPLTAVFDRVSEALAGQGLMRGSGNSRTVVSVLAYVGMGNFGDEYILATIDKRMRRTVPGSSIVAISENPLHTLRNRGIFALSLRDKYMLDAALSYASAALTIAGLLFDQGIRWGMGKAELTSLTRVSDVPGITAYALLAAMNGAKPLFYGIGAGPLEVEDGRRLVELMGRAGAGFIARDQETSDLLLSCGLPKNQVATCADTAFLGEPCHSGFVDAWLEKEGVSLDAGDRIFAVSLREYENAPHDFDERVAFALDALASAHEEVHFAFCVLDPADEDLSRKVIARMKHASRAHVFNPGQDLEPFSDILHRCFAGLSMRYHCSLLLQRSGIPCAGLDYLPKVASLYKEVGCSELLLPMGAEADRIAACLLGMVDAREEWAATVVGRVAELRRRAQQAEGLMLECVRARNAGKAGFVAHTYFLANELAPEAECRYMQAQAHDANARAQRAEEENARLAEELRCVRASRSFKVGLAITAFPRALKRAFSKRA